MKIEYSYKINNYDNKIQRIIKNTDCNYTADISSHVVSCRFAKETGTHECLASCVCVHIDNGFIVFRCVNDVFGDIIDERAEPQRY